MLHHSSIFKTDINICILPISNNSSFHATVHHSSFAKAVFSRCFHVWIGDFTFFKCTIRFMFHHRSIFKTDVNVHSVFILNNSSFHATVHHFGFTKTIFSRGFNVWIGDFTFFKFSILSMFHQSPIFETHIDVFICIISNNSSFHATVHHSSFAKTVFCRNFHVWICNSAFFKQVIRLMFCYSSVFKTDINICSTSISNDCSFHATTHHFSFSKSICFYCHKLPLAFLHLLLHCCYKCRNGYMTCIGYSNRKFIFTLMFL